MHITLETKSISTLADDAVVTYLFEESDPIQGRVAELDKLTGGLLARLAKSGELTGKSLEMTLVHAPAGLKTPRLLLVGAGKREQFNPATLRKVAGAALRYLKTRGVHKLAFALREGDLTEDAAQAVTEAAIIADFETDKYKTDKKIDKFIESLSLAGFAPVAQGESASPAAFTAAREASPAGARLGIRRTSPATSSIEPSNKLTPRILAEKAEAMAKEAGLKVEILDEQKITDLKMGALLSVAQGSDEPPRVIVITYTPANSKPGAPVIGLVGKAVTFDTGGISIKPADGMEKMKYDMAGGATMLGVMRAIAAAQAQRQSICVDSRHRKHARRQSAKARRHPDRHVRQND